uniref:Uncharacterized protein n=1 Tax=Clastoptera arizonana TaxID=38151 RepID=A0A1B6CTQ6_9HEMI
MESDDIHSARFDQPKQLQEPENTNIKDEVSEIKKALHTTKDNLIHKTYQRIETTNVITSSQNSINDDIHYCITYGNDNKMQTNANQVDKSQRKQHHHCSLHLKDNSKSKNSTLNTQFSNKSLAYYVGLPQDKNLDIQTNNKRVFNISRNENKILICKPINPQGEPVKVNDRFLNNKLMLSCKPQNYSEFSVEEKYSYKDQYLSDCYDNSKQPEIVIPSQDLNDYRQRNNQAISKNANEIYYKSKKEM